MKLEIRNPKSASRMPRQEQDCREPGIREGFGLQMSGFGVPPRGFTLLELLLAIAVFGIVLLAIHTVFYAALRLRNKTTDALDAAVPVQQTLGLIRRDLLNLVAPNDTLCGPLQTDPTNTTIVLGRRGGFTVSPTLHTAVGIVDDLSSWGEVQQVTYVLATPTNQAPGLDLLRNVRRNHLPVLDDTPEEQWLLDGVETLAFQFYDGTQWLDMWDSSTSDPALPVAIKVQLQLVSDSTLQVRPTPIELIVPITVQARTNLTSASEGGEGS